MSFIAGYYGLPDVSSETNVCCPFPHSFGHYESHPSAHFKTDDQGTVFNCKTCGASHNDVTFAEAILGCSPKYAHKIALRCKDCQSIYEWRLSTPLSEGGRKLANSFGISNEVIKELDIQEPMGLEGQALCFPVTLYDNIVDVRTYTPGGSPKVKSLSGGLGSMIYPYDIWRQTQKARVTLICAGEKDMAVARSQGFNAITLTCGEGNLPKILKDFKDREIAIVYDNDDPGRDGALKLAECLYEHSKHVKVVTSFHQVCSEPKEDITDFFTKYGKTKQDLIAFIESTPYYEPDPQVLATKQCKWCDLYTASQPDNINKLVRSNIQVVAIADTTFTVPTSVTMEKYKLSDKDTMGLNECREWDLTNNNLSDALHLMDNNFREEAIDENLRGFMYIRKTEKYIRKRVFSTVTVYKAYVTDMYETNVEDATPMEYQAYSFGCRLESGQKYAVTYKLVPHPYKGQQLVMLITNAEQANDSVSNFQVTDEVREDLALFRDIPGNTAEKVTTLVNKVKGLIGYNGNNTLIKAIDLSYHTALQFNFARERDIRGYLDTLIVGESRTGKSSTANALRKEYELGIFTSLAGNSATIPGLIGGSNKTQSGFQTRAGVIPQNHRGLIIFEEFGKCKQDVISELTDIRSSNEVRIARVSGSITLPAMVRMIALTNAKTTGSNIKPISTYPNGISVVTELVGTAEDIARYDLILVLADLGNAQIDPFWNPEDPMPTRAYRNRVRWVWSRTAEEVVIPKEVELYLVERANKLNEEFNSHIKLFGTEAWKKLARLSIAVAGYTVSTDETFENIVVTKDCVDWAEAYYREVYDNDVFKLREYVANERLYSEIDNDGISALQDLYTKYTALVLQLEKSMVCSKNMLSSASGLTTDDLNKALSAMTRCLFIQYQGYDIIPTTRFRKGMKAINTGTVIKKIGEE